MEDENKQVASPTPGHVIVPGSSVQAATPVPVDSQPVLPPTQPVTPVSLSGRAVEPPEQSSTYDEDGISWTASEFISHEKSAQWYLTVGAVAIVTALIVVLITSDFITAGVILFAAVLFGVVGSRKPRQLPYRVDGFGIQIGEKRFPYDSFKSFALMPDGPFSSIALLPLKRFAPLLTLYFSPEDEDAIVTFLADRLPGEVRQQDVVDRLLRRIRF